MNDPRCVLASESVAIASLEPGKRGCTSTGRFSNGKHIIHTTFNHGAELIEEYEVGTQELVSRKWRTASKLGAAGRWTYEIGEDVKESKGVVGGGLMAVASGRNPTMVARDKQLVWQWRFRNLPYPKDVYSVTVETKKQKQSSASAMASASASAKEGSSGLKQQELVLRTSNKKYFKRFSVPAMTRNQLPLEQHCISFSHGNNTLVIEYDKPQSVIEAEAAAKEARRHAASNKTDGQADCKTQ